MPNSLTDKLHSKVIAFEQLKRDLPPVLGNMGQNFFRRSFENQGFTDKALEKWREVKRRTPGTLAYKYPKKNAGDRHVRAILVGIGSKGGIHLRQSVNSSLKRASWEEILWSVPHVYASVHNDGLRAGRGAGFIMPKRKFMGYSYVLLKDMDRVIRLKMRNLGK